MPQQHSKLVLVTLALTEEEIMTQLDVFSHGGGIEDSRENVGASQQALQANGAFWKSVFDID